MTLDDILLQARKVTYQMQNPWYFTGFDKRTIERGGHKDVNSADDSKTSGSVL